MFAPDCAVRVIITMEALKEGWDCSFAYVLCSVSGTKSATAIEQLLGRPVYLDLHVRIAKEWQRDPKQLRRLGF